MPHNEEKQTFSRRDALKTLAAITGAVTLASLPGKWQTPVVKVGALPVHAQGSGGTAIVFNNTFGPVQVALLNGAIPIMAQSVVIGPVKIAEGDSHTFTDLEAGQYNVDVDVDVMEQLCVPMADPDSFELPAGGTQQVLVECEFFREEPN